MAARAVRIVRRLCMPCHILHAVSAPCMRYQWHRMHCACGVNDTACILKIRISSRIRFLAPWSGAQDGCYGEKNRGSKISWHCPFKGGSQQDLEILIHLQYSAWLLQKNSYIFLLFFANVPVLKINNQNNIFITMASLKIELMKARRVILFLFSKFASQKRLKLWYYYLYCLNY
jgi:hypothetical protein